MTEARRTFARFLRHSVQAFGVTTPSPRLRFEFCVLEDCAPAVWFEAWLADEPVAAGVEWLCDGVPELPDVEAPCGVLSVLAPDWFGTDGVWLRLVFSSLVMIARPCSGGGFEF